MIGFCPLASGSKGNCLFLGTDKTRILIDAGLSGKATQAKLSEIGIPLDTIEAILISHEHTDHIQGLKALAAKAKIPVFCNHDTAKAIVDTLSITPTFKLFSTGETFHFKDLEIHPFNIQHDAIDPVGFTIKIDSLKVGICSDLGFASTLVEAHLRECDYLYLEANHEPSMVHACSRPPLYKQRVLSRSGHLSNQECAELLTKIMHPALKHVFLAHLSSECNTPERALTTVRSALDRHAFSPTVSVAFQETPSTPIFF